MRRQEYAELMDACPVARVDRHGGFDLVSGYAEARDVAMRADEFFSSDGVFIPPNDLPRIPALEYDGEEHAPWRELMAGLLTPAAVRELEPMVTEIVNAQIDSGTWIPTAISWYSDAPAT
jgi:cytochrome P450